MLPLDTIVATTTAGTKIRRKKSLEASLQALRAAGTHGVMIDAWWGLVEAAGPGRYDWTAYSELFAMVAKTGLKIQVVMSYHACGGNVGDSGVSVRLPPWVQDVGRRESHIYYRDRSGKYNEEYLSLGVDKLPLLHGRTAAQCYTDVLKSFTTTFRSYLGTTISEITIGLGPAGELRYPAYPEGDGRWHFPGIGEFQCYDKYMLEDLKEAADAYGRPEWGLGGPHDAGHYKSLPWETRFFEFESGTFASEYGHFFLDWYSRKLIDHADLVLGEAAKVLQSICHGSCERGSVHLGAKIAGVHWWYRSRSHAAELTTGYYNTRHRDGYTPIANVLAKHGAALNFTCVEMHDSEHPEDCFCSPQGLLWQMRCTAQRANIPLSGENALQRYDEAAFDRVLHNTYSFPAPLQTFTFLRMGEALFAQHNWSNFVRFVQSMCSAAQAGPAEENCRVTTNNCRGDLCSV
eukprot:SM000111S18812  [mRNA]  locus=s111:412288:415503:+ [translate_table: standard]